MNNLAAFVVLLWVTGWTVAAIRAGLQNRTGLCSVRGRGCTEYKSE